MHPKKLVPLNFKGGITYFKIYGLPNNIQVSTTFFRNICASKKSGPHYFKVVGPNILKYMVRPYNIYGGPIIFATFMHPKKLVPITFKGGQHIIKYMIPPFNI